MAVRGMVIPHCFGSNDFLLNMRGDCPAFPMSLKELLPEEMDILECCLYTTYEGADIFPHGEFHTLFGLHRFEFGDLLRDWPEFDWSIEVWQTLSNCLNNLLDHPHPYQERWEERFLFERADLESLLAKWSGIRPPAPMKDMRLAELGILDCCLNFTAEISFDCIYSDDNEVMEGCFRLPGDDWRVFVFAKWPEGPPQIFMNAIWENGIAGIEVHQRRKSILNKSVAIDVLADVLGFPACEVLGPDSNRLK